MFVYNTRFKIIEARIQFFCGCWFTIPFFKISNKRGIFFWQFSCDMLESYTIEYNCTSLIPESHANRLMLQQYRCNDSLILTLTLSWAHPGQKRVFDLRWGGFIQWKWSWLENLNRCWRHWLYVQCWMQYTVITGTRSFYFKSK